jgi:arabinose-5-phosphate isomerase
MAAGYTLHMSVESAQNTTNAPPPSGIEPQRALALGRNVLATEAAAIRALEGRLGGAFLAATRMLLGCRGRVVVTGIGKSGHIARKLAATLASTGTPAFFVHATEASHGDLGMITADDVVLMLSNSGETDELVSLMPHLKRQGAQLIALTGNEESSLAQAADVHLDASVDTEACPLGLAPTASTTAALALGDALALTLLDARGFSVEDFARAHPGGALGRRLLTHVRDVMRSGAAVPCVQVSATLAQAVVEMSGKGMGMTAVVDADARVVGIFTDGDLRRCLEHVSNFATSHIDALMTRTPRTIGADALAIDCVERMETAPKVSQLLVVDAESRLVGALHLHDLFRAKVV